MKFVPIPFLAVGRIAPRVLLTAATILLAAGTGAGPAAAQVEPQPGAPALVARDLRQAMLAAEDGRAATPAARRPLVEGLSHPSASLRQLAVRALGRLEDASLVEQVKPLVADPSPSVRAEAANALAQAVSRQADRAPAAREALVARLRVEREPSVVGAIAESLGRLPCATEADVRLTEQVLVRATRAPSRNVSVEPSHKVAGVDISWGDRRLHDAPVAAVTGAVKGLESLIRLRRKIAAPAEPTLARLRELASWSAQSRSGPPAAATAGRAEPEARVRRLALLALTSAGAADAATLAGAMADADWQVRRLATAAVSAPSAAPLREVIDRAVADPSPHVRTEAVRAVGSLGAPARCETLATMARDDDTHVALAAIDALASCGNVAPAAGHAMNLAVAALAEIASRIPSDPATDRAGFERGTWHAPAHALVALARLAPGAARPYLQQFTPQPIWQARMYAARAAAVLAAAGDAGGATPVASAPDAEDPVAVLERLATDSRANVREAAITGLSQVRGHLADSIFIEALGATDYQLIMTAARALKGSAARDRAVPALLASLDRITAERRDTSRDPRRVILERLGELGSVAAAERLRRYLNDFDPLIAGLAAATLTSWTGRAHSARTTREGTGDPPSAAEAAALRESVAVVTMAGGGSFTMRLFPDEAPATVLRFVRLARALYYDTLTFHRVVPNFVIQGGSAGANEYVGDGAYMRDELGLRGHTRGAVGISTRGRDTGDAQIFVNLVDNARLDHDYTVFAEVIDGMSVVDAILEGAEIARIAIVAGDKGARREPAAPHGVGANDAFTTRDRPGRR